MAGWRDLSGYLCCKPTGALSIFKVSKRQWYVFEENGCQLVFYKSQQDAAAQKLPIGFIAINGSSINVNLEQQNQFIIHSEGKEHVLQADSHESMMIWMLGLQAKRDATANQQVKQPKSFLAQKFSNRRRDSAPLMQTSQDFTRKNNNFIKKTKKVAKKIDNKDCTLMSVAANNCSIEEEEEDEEKGKWFDANLSLSHSFSTGISSKAIDNSSSESINYDDVFNAADYNVLHVDCTQQHHTNDNKESSNSIQVNESSSATGGNSVTVHNPIGIKKEQEKWNSLLEHHLKDLKIQVANLQEELMLTKEQLVSVLDQESCLKEVLAKRERNVMDLDEKVSKLEQLEHFIKTRITREKNIRSIDHVHVTQPKDSKLEMKDLREKCRRFQNQNRFLNEEVRKLTKMRYTDKQEAINQTNKINSLNLEMESWKGNYVSLFQTNLRGLQKDRTEGFQLKLPGINKSIDCLRTLFEEARSKNSNLPSFDSLISSKFHVDRFGFKHCHEEECTALQYACSLLQEYYTSQSKSHEDHQIKWKEYMKKNGRHFSFSRELKMLCRNGVPKERRSEVWRRLIYMQVRETMQLKGPHYYNNISSQILESEVAGSHRKQISLDIYRTMPTNIRFEHNDTDGIKNLQEVLQTFTIHNPSIGYCQGMNFIAGFGLLFLNKEDTFWLLVAFTENYFPTAYFHLNLIGAQADQCVMKDMLTEKLPKLHKHLHQLDIDIANITLPWFLSVFFDVLPVETLIRIWDCFLYEGPKVLFRFSLAILSTYEDALLLQQDTIGIWKNIKMAAKFMYDVNDLLETAFCKLKPFPHRREIFAKQSTYLRSLQVKEKVGHKERCTQQLNEMKIQKFEGTATTSNNLIIECSTNLGNGRLLLTFGEQTGAYLSLVNLERKCMRMLDVKFDSKILCIAAIEFDLVLIGLLNMNVQAFDVDLQKCLWQCQLHDSILDLSVLPCINGRFENKVFAALADGSIAVMENVGRHEPLSNIFYVTIDSAAPVSSLLLLKHELWCACGNAVQIFHATTLDQKDQFQVSNSPFDNILSLSAGQCGGVWITIKGSSVIQWWDNNTMTCKLLYDTKEMRYSEWQHDDDDYQYNPRRVSTLLSSENTVWIGTGQGDLIVFEIVILNEASRLRDSAKTSAHSLSAIKTYQPYGKTRQTQFFSRATQSENISKNTSVVTETIDHKKTHVFEMNLKKDKKGTCGEALHLEIVYNVQNKDAEIKSYALNKSTDIDDESTVDDDTNNELSTNFIHPLSPSCFYHLISLNTLDDFATNDDPPNKPPNNCASIYDYNLNLIVRHKISQSSVRTLTLANVKKKKIIFSSAGCYGDVEAFLIWHDNLFEHNSWTSERIIEKNQ